MREFWGRIESLGAMIGGMTADPCKWDAVVEFSNRIMDRKEEVEREEQAELRRGRLIAETERSIGETRGRTGQPASRRLGRTNQEK